MKTDEIGRKIKFNIEINELLITVINIYAPNIDQPQFFEDVFRTIALSSEHRIIIGDFNLVMNTSIDRIGNSSKQDKIIRSNKKCTERVGSGGHLANSKF